MLKSIHFVIFFATLIITFLIVFNIEKVVENNAIKACKQRSSELSHKYKDQKYLFPPKSEQTLTEKCKDVIITTNEKCYSPFCRISEYISYEKEMKALIKSQSSLIPPNKR